MLGGAVMHAPLLSRSLPVLPLKDIVLLPGMIVRLHVIQPPLVGAVEAHLANPTRLLLALPQLDPNVDDPLPEDLSEIGCTARVLKAVRLGDGTVRVLLEGGDRARSSSTSGCTTRR